MVCVDHCLGIGEERKRVLVYGAEALATQRLISDLEVDIGGAEVLLSHGLLVLALG